MGDFSISDGGTPDVCSDIGTPLMSDMDDINTRTPSPISSVNNYADSSDGTVEVAEVKSMTEKEASESGCDVGEANEEAKHQKEGEGEDDQEEDYSKLYTDWPLEEIKEPHEHDVLYGRGGGTNHHPGNKRYRRIVEERKIEYVNCKRLEKPQVALDIIRQWRRNQTPPGRFLKMDEETHLWSDVGDKRAREKTSQALREKAPVLRKQQEEGVSGTDSNAQNEGRSGRSSLYSRSKNRASSPGWCDGGSPFGDEHDQDQYIVGDDNEPLPPDIGIVEDDPIIFAQGITPIQIERKEPLVPTAPGRPPKNTRFAKDVRGSPDTHVMSNKSSRPSRNVPKSALGRLHSLGTEIPERDCLDGFSWNDPVNDLEPSYSNSTAAPIGCVGDGLPQLSESGNVPGYETPVLPPLLQPVPLPVPPAGRDMSLSSVGSFNSAFAPVQRSASSQSDNCGTSLSRGSSDQISLDDEGFYSLKSTRDSSSLRRDHSLGMNPLRHATCQEAAMRTKFEMEEEMRSTQSFRPNPRHAAISRQSSEEPYWTHRTNEPVGRSHQRDTSDGTTGSHDGGRLPAASHRHHPSPAFAGYGPEAGRYPNYGPPKAHYPPLAAIAPTTYSHRQMSDQSYHSLPPAQMEHMGPASRGSSRAVSDQASYDYSRQLQYSKLQQMHVPPPRRRHGRFNDSSPPTPGSSGLQGYMRQLSVTDSAVNTEHHRRRSFEGQPRMQSDEKSASSAWPSLPPIGISSSAKAKRRSVDSSQLVTGAGAEGDGCCIDKTNSGDFSSASKADKSIPRPIIKRNTSHQNENNATKKESKLCRRAGPKPCGGKLVREHTFAGSPLADATLDVDTANIFNDEETEEGLRHLPSNISEIKLNGESLSGDEELDGANRQYASADSESSGNEQKGAMPSKPAPMSYNNRSSTIEVFAREFGGGDNSSASWLDGVDNFEELTSS